MELTKEIKETVLKLFERNGYCTHENNNVSYSTICFDSENYIGVYLIHDLSLQDQLVVQIDRSLDPDTNNYTVNVLRS